jgi:hypothetical protein
LKALRANYATRGTVSDIKPERASPTFRLLSLRLAFFSSLFRLLQATIRNVDEQMREINKKIDALKERHGENYGEVVKCIVYHENILRCHFTPSPCETLTFILLLVPQLLCGNSRHLHGTHFCTDNGLDSNHLHDVLLAGESEQQSRRGHWIGLVPAHNGHSNSALLLDWQ